MRSDDDVQRAPTTGAPDETIIAFDAASEAARGMAEADTASDAEGDDGAAGVIVEAGASGAGASADPREGTVLAGRYRLVARLGRGGMGTVYRAEHLLMKKQVAIKVLLPHLVDDELVLGRFQREAQAAAHIDHPAVCRATDFGQAEDGSFFLVMEHLEGDTLAQVIEREGRLPVARALEIARQVCEGLTAAHALGVIHRDLKPENLMLLARSGERERVKILDFGVARVQFDGDAGRSSLTQTGTVFGTPLYMSPEQARGLVVDTRSDLYTLGVILYELLTGRPPFLAESVVRILGMHVTDPPPPMNDVAPTARIPSAVEELVRSLLRKEAADRPASAAVVQQRIEALQRTLGGGLLQEMDGALGELVRPLRRGLRARMRASGPAGRIGWMVGVFGVAALVLFLVGSTIRAVVVAGVEDPATVGALHDARDAFVARRDIAPAVGFLDAGRADRAVEVLRPLEAGWADDPHFAYLYGRALWLSGAREEGLAQYERALDRAPGYADEVAFVEHAATSFESTKATEAARAEALLTRFPSDASVSRLDAIAREHRQRAVRQRATAVLEQTGALDRLEPWSRLSIRLRTAPGCHPKLEVLEEMRKLGDSRVLPALEVLHRAPKTGCGLLDMQDCYACLRGTLAAARTELRAKEAAP